ncbi:MAG: PQQ-binding-like beta-propeller repeat protein [Bacteroidota bacterium]
MNHIKDESRASQGDVHKTLRITPGIVIVIIQWLLWMFIPRIFPGAWISAVGVMGGLLGGIAVLIWWVFFSRAPRFDRWNALILWILSLFVAYTFTDESITTGMQGMMFPAFALPVLSLVFVIWAVASRHLSLTKRRISMLICILLASGVWILLRSEGMTGDARIDLAWRWSETSEEKLLSQSGKEQVSMKATSLSMGTEAEWPGFRGVQRDSKIQDLKIETDWTTSPPLELWRRPVGPGCSSFAVHGEMMYTLEQRGDNEVVACYNLHSGDPVWKYSYEARFWDSHAGAGPRSTPTLSNGRVYTLGATGILNVIDETDGTLIWSRDAASETGMQSLEWGFASSPLVVNELVIVAVSGKLAAYDIEAGEPSWYGPDGGESWSSPHLLSIDGVEQVVFMSESGATSFQPEDGKVLWEHPWPGAQIVQPAFCEDGDLIISAGNAKGIGRFKVSLASDVWTVEERWISVRLRPNFNDFVVHKGHAYGFEGPSLACLDLEDGKRKWKSGRYGGQILLLADQDLLLVLTEKGELTLVEALPSKHTELSKFPAIESKTWNHPVLVNDILLVRNTQEMAAFRLKLLK